MRHGFRAAAAKRSSALALPGFVISREEIPALLAGRVAALAPLARWTDAGALALLILATCTLIFRPADIIPALEGAPIYESCMFACLALSLPRAVRWLAARAPRASAITSLLLLLVPAVALSHLAHADTWDARRGAVEQAKAFLLLLAIVGLVDSAGRLRALLGAVAASVVGVTILALLNHYGVMSLPGISGVAQRSPDGEGDMIMRLRGTGVFNDPNDFALILVVAMSICGYGLGERGIRWARWLLLGALALLGLALVLTHSRGGLMSAVAASLAFLTARAGWRNAIPVAGILVLLLLVPVWGREAHLNLDDPEDTFQARLDLWNASLDAFRSAPILGIGQGKLTEAIGQVTHNSYLHAFAEMGLFGGTIFIGAFYLAIRGLWRAASADPALSRLKPFVLAGTVGYATGLLALSRCYTVPTQLVLGVAAAFLALASRSGNVVVPPLDATCLRRISGVAAVFLGAVYVFIRVMQHP